MGSPNAQAYLASPAVVATSAVAGYINYDWNDAVVKIFGEIKTNIKTEKQKLPLELLMTSLLRSKVN